MKYQILKVKGVYDKSLKEVKLPNMLNKSI